MASKKTNYIDDIYEIVALIPPGRVTSYGLIADAIGTRTTARMVGWAMNKAHAAVPSLPAHRVVNRNGLLTGRHHFATSQRMQELLEAEGIEVENNQVKDFQDKLWVPLNEIGI